MFLFCLFRSCWETSLLEFAMFRVFTASFSPNSFEFARLLRNTLKYWFSFPGRESRPCLSPKICLLSQVCWGGTPPSPLSTPSRVARSLSSLVECVLHHVGHNIVVPCLSLSVSGIHDIINITVRVVDWHASCCASLAALSVTFSNWQANAAII